MQPTERLYNYYDSKFQVSPQNQIQSSKKDQENIIQTTLTKRDLKINGDSSKSNILRKLEILQKNSPFQNNRPLRVRQHHIDAHNKLKEKKLAQNDSPIQEDSKLMSENDVNQSNVKAIQNQFTEEKKIQESPQRGSQSSFCPSTTPPIGIKPSLVSKINNGSPSMRSENIVDTVDIDKKLIIISSQKQEKQISLKQNTTQVNNYQQQIKAYDSKKSMPKLDLNKIKNAQQQIQNYQKNQNSGRITNLINQGNNSISSQESIKLSVSHIQQTNEKVSQDEDSIERFPLNISLEGIKNNQQTKNSDRSNNINLLQIDIEKKEQNTTRPQKIDYYNKQKYNHEDSIYNKFPVQSQNSTARQSMGNPIHQYVQENIEKANMKNKNSNKDLQILIKNQNESSSKSNALNTFDNRSKTNVKIEAVSDKKQQLKVINIDDKNNEMEKYFNLIIDDDMNEQQSINQHDIQIKDQYEINNSFDSSQKSSFYSINAESLIAKTEDNRTSIKKNNQSVNMMHSNCASSISKISKFSKIQEILAVNYLNNSNLSSCAFNQTQQSLISENQSNRTFRQKGDKEFEKQQKSSFFKTSSKIEKFIFKIQNKIEKFTTDEFDILREDVKNKGFIEYMKDNKLIEVQEPVKNIDEMPFEIIESQKNIQPADNDLSLLCRQIIIKNQISNQNIKIQCTGFMSAPKVYFFPEKEDFISNNLNQPLAINSDFQNKHKASIIPLENEFYQSENQNQQFLLNELISKRILNIFVKLQCKIVSCGFEHCIALMTSLENQISNQNKNYGRIFTWGLGASGCLGHGGYETLEEPKEVIIKDINGNNLLAQYVESGGYHNGLIAENGNVYMWGRGDVGQLGIKKSSLQLDKMGLVQLSPKIIDFNGKVIQIALGDAHSLLLSQDQQHENNFLGDTIYSCGWNDLGQLGIGEISQKSLKDIDKISWHQVLFQQKQNKNSSKYQNQSKNEKFRQIKCGAVFSLALTEKGEVYTWGSNSHGQIGGISLSEIDNISKIDSKSAAEYISQKSSVHDKKAQKQSNYPQKVIFDCEKPVESVNVQEIFAGDCHVIARTNIELFKDSFSNSKQFINGKLYSWGQGVFVDNLESSDVICNKPVILGDGIENVMTYTINQDLESFSQEYIQHNNQSEENGQNSSGIKIQGTFSSNSLEKQKIKASTERIQQNSKQVLIQNTILNDIQNRDKLKTDSESNITTIKNTEDYRNFLKKESSEIINFDEKIAQQNQINKNFYSKQNHQNLNQSQNLNLNKYNSQNLKFQKTQVSIFQNCNYKQQGLKGHDSNLLNHNSQWTSDGDYTDAAKIKELNSNNSLITIGGLLSQQSNLKFKQQESNPIQNSENQILHFNQQSQVQEFNLNDYKQINLMDQQQDNFDIIQKQDLSKNNQNSQNITINNIYTNKFQLNQYSNPIAFNNNVNKINGSNDVSNYGKSNQSDQKLKLQNIQNQVNKSIDINHIQIDLNFDNINNQNDLIKQQYLSLDKLIINSDKKYNSIQRNSKLNNQIQTNQLQTKTHRKSHSQNKQKVIQNLQSRLPASARQAILSNFIQTISSRRQKTNSQGTNGAEIAQNQTARSKITNQIENRSSQAFNTSKGNKPQISINNIKSNAKSKRTTINSLDQKNQYRSQHHIGNFEIQIHKNYHQVDKQQNKNLEKYLHTDRSMDEKEFISVKSKSKSCNNSQRKQQQTYNLIDEKKQFKNNLLLQFKQSNVIKKNKFNENLTASNKQESIDDQIENDYQSLSGPQGQGGGGICISKKFSGVTSKGYQTEEGMLDGEQPFQKSISGFNQTQKNPFSICPQQDYIIQSINSTNQNNQNDNFLNQTRNQQIFQNKYHKQKSKMKTIQEKSREKIQVLLTEQDQNTNLSQNNSIQSLRKEDVQLHSYDSIPMQQNNQKIDIRNNKHLLDFNKQNQKSDSNTKNENQKKTINSYEKKAPLVPNSGSNIVQKAVGISSNKSLGSAKQSQVSMASSSQSLYSQSNGKFKYSNLQPVLKSSASKKTINSQKSIGAVNNNEIR